MTQQQNCLYYTIDVKFFVYYSMAYVDKIFVYGNNKRDQVVNHGLDHVEYIGKANTINKFDMFNLGGYPGVAYNLDKGYKILGDLYQVNRDQITDLDDLKGDGIYFERVLEQIFVVGNNPRRNGYLVDAWMYVLSDKPTHLDDSNIFLTNKNYLTYERI